MVEQKRTPTPPIAVAKQQHQESSLAVAVPIRKLAEKQNWAQVVKSPPKPKPKFQKLSWADMVKNAGQQPSLTHESNRLTVSENDLSSLNG